MKFLNVKISLAGMTLLFLLLAASLLGFNSVMPTAAVASLPIDDTTTTSGGGDISANNTTTMSENNTSSSATTTTTSAAIIELADESFAVGHYRTVSNNMTSETQVQFTFEGNTTITVPNSTETIKTIDRGQGNVTFLPEGGGVVIRGQIHMTTEDGSENATADFTEYMKSEESRGVGVAYFSTSSTENLALLNNMIALYLDEIQPNEDSIVSFFEWKSGGAVPIGTGTTTSSANNTTMTTTQTPVTSTP
jgi:hypothetical protein